MYVHTFSKNNEREREREGEEKREREKRIRFAPPHKRILYQLFYNERRRVMPIIQQMMCTSTSTHT